MGSELEIFQQAATQGFAPGTDYTTLSYDEMVQAVRTVEHGSKWLTGDIGAAMETTYSDRTLAGFAADVGMEYSTLRDYVAVSKAYPRESVARATHSWSTYRSLAAQDDRLELVSGDPMTVAEARTLVAARMTAQQREHAEQAQAQQAADKTLRQAIRATQRGTPERREAAATALRAAGGPEPSQEAPQPQDIPQAPPGAPEPAQPRTEAALPLAHQPDGTWTCSACAHPVDVAATNEAMRALKAAVPPGNVPPGPAPAAANGSASGTSPAGTGNGSSGRPQPAPGDWFARLSLAIYDFKRSQGATHDSAMAAYSGAYRSLTQRPALDAFVVVDKHVPDRAVAAELLSRWEVEAGLPLTRPPAGART